MENISGQVGSRIRYFRKKRGLSSDQLAFVINKSKATVSKYERGAIMLDVETLSAIAAALEVDVALLMDFKPAPAAKAAPVLGRGFLNDNSELYLFHYDGYRRKLTRSLLHVFSGADTEDCPRANLYMDLPSFAEYHRSLHLYSGRLQQYDAVIYLFLENKVNPMEKVCMYMMQPLHQESSLYGILLGILSSPVIPVAFKFLASKKNIDDPDKLQERLKISKEDIREMKRFNMFVFDYHIGG